jgi:hypothetical protein
MFLFIYYSFELRAKLLGLHMFNLVQFCASHKTFGVAHVQPVPFGPFAWPEAKLKQQPTGLLFSGQMFTFALEAQRVQF